jgi:hypothetical protein
MDRFALSLKLHKKIDVTSVEKCALYIKYSNKKATIVQGYCITENGEKMRYYWVEDDKGELYDVSYAVAKLIVPEVGTLKYTLTKDEPSGDVQFDEKNDSLYEVYKEKPKEFWKRISTTHK